MERIIWEHGLCPEARGTDDPFNVKSRWDAAWITAAHAENAMVVNYTLEAELPSDTVVHVSASDRYILYCDGALAGRGPAKGTHSIWYFDSYRISAGRHEIKAVVFAQKICRAWSQISFGNRFILDAEEHKELLATGFGAWKAAEDKRYSETAVYSPQFPAQKIGVGGRIVFDAEKESAAAESVIVLEKGYEYSGYDIQARIPRLRPNTLPPMIENPITLDVKETVAPHTKFCRLIALENYYCAYPRLTISGGAGAKIALSFAEGLYDADNRKGDRSVTKGKEFRGIGDTYYPNGEANATLEPLWWLAGRYVLIEAETGAEPLQIHGLTLLETRYPFEMQADLSELPPFLQKIGPRMMRTLQCCMHETYMDCPHYEQLMYLGDTRIQILIGYVVNQDTRLAERAMELLGAAVSLANGELPCAYPVNGSRIIPGFCLYFVGILYDYLVHVGKREVIRPYLGIAHGILDAYTSELYDGVAPTPAGWNFYDWSAGWQSGIPQEQSEICVEFNAHLVYTLYLQAEIERRFDEPELVARCIRYADSIKDALLKRQVVWSEHALCFMLLSGALNAEEEKELLDLLLRTNGETLSVYFSHYLFEVYRKYRLYSHMDEYLKKWSVLERDRFYTVPEEFTTDTRSDCHAWGAHPLYHYIMKQKENGLKQKNV